MNDNCMQQCVAEAIIDPRLSWLIEGGYQVAHVYRFSGFLFSLVDGTRWISINQGNHGTLPE